MSETQVEELVSNPIAGSSNSTSEPETIFIQVRRSQRKGMQSNHINTKCSYVCLYL